MMDGASVGALDRPFDTIDAAMGGLKQRTRSVNRMYLLVAAVTVVGSAILALALLDLRHQSITVSMVVLAALAVASGRFAINVPGRPATVSVSEVFIFTSMLMFGPAPATVTVALDGLVVSLRQKNRRLYRTLFNVAEPAIAVWVAGTVSFAVMQHPWIAAYSGSAVTMLPTLAMTATFFVLNSTLTAAAVGLDTETSAYEVWSGHAGPLVLNYFAAASLASLAVTDGTTFNFKVVGLVGPLLIVSYVAYREAARRLEEAQRHIVEVEQLYAEARKKDEELRQAQKLEAIGRLAGGVAHDFNNILTAIQGYGELLGEALDDGDRRREDLDEIMKAAQRATGLTRQLLAFSRKQVVNPKVISLPGVVTGTEKMLRRLIGEDVELVTRIDAAVGPVKADAGQIEQVLLNLVVNARDAMPNGGTIAIELENALEGNDTRPAALGSVPYVRLSVTDTGSGIDESILPRIFDPFFTTKEIGRGTGLGLSTVYGIVQQAGGRIDVASTVGRGTAFHVFLPHTDASPDATPASASPMRSTGSETIMLVEDDVAVRALIATGLRRAGYVVREAGNAHEALDDLKRGTTGIDLLLTDVVMPDMNGRELADQVTVAHPETRVLFMSGYSDDAILRRGVQTNSASFIQKPFPMPVLIARVREILDSSSSSVTGTEALPIV